VRRSPRARLSLLLAAAVVLAVTLSFGAGGGAAAQPGATTSTLPTDNRELGEIIPRPNQGMAPRDAGDPGGWLQVSLFFLLCAAVFGMALAVWWISRRARARRDAAGLDPVELARRRGEGVRAPRASAGSGDPAQHP
jgi:hypothetical protein